uniref:retrovirus-related Pol polyprotein from transposon gypsy n=1 Tax=Fragaria vesca subsp. vesca TaxID=101020 RepID=UPI0005C7E8B7|nr:PREDICTED: retrovirus-related Pol polyprotein from transposon gypsy [Fragaria vesca subsp. vesca]
MQLKGKILNKTVHVLIDLGALHNFVHPAALKTSKHVVQKINPIKVRLASGAIMHIKGQVELEIVLQGITLTNCFYVLPISGCEVVMGASWLKTLGDIIWNFETMVMKFQIGGKTECLQGLTTPQASFVSCKSMTKLLRKEREAMLVQVHSIATVKHKPKVHPAIKSLLDKYAAVFEPPNNLPPPRAQDHKIELAPNTPPINVRPYSPYSSPVLLVKKKDGTWRLCVDYRALNAATIKDKYPILVVDELIDEVHGSMIFTKLDLRSSYHQIRMAESDIPKTAFRTHSGHYEFLVMPFGLTNAPSTFQSLMNDVLRDYLRKGVLVFFDDILIYSPSLAAHLQHLEWVFQALQKNSLVIKESKCSFGAAQVEYLGHVISGKGVAVDPSKIECVKKWLLPKTIKELRGFLGLAGYYRKYVKGFGLNAKPLTSLLKKDGFKWEERATKAFEELKTNLTSTSVLAFPDFSKPFTVEYDASEVGIGAVISQEGHPIAFMSKALSQRHIALLIYDKEMLAVVMVVQHWRPYFIGHHFIIYTNHKTIEHFLTQKNNASPDSLSRSTALNAIKGTSVPTHEFVSDIKKACLTDPTIVALIQTLQSSPNSKKHYSLHKLLYKGKFVAHCDVCQQNHYEAIRPPGLLQLINIPDKAWSLITVNFIEGLPKSHDEADAQLRSRDELLALVKRNLHQAQARMKAYYDRNHTECQFQVGDWVYVKLQPYKQTSVLERIGVVAYKLQLPATARIHNVFHVSLLKKRVGHDATVEATLPNISDSSAFKWVLEEILQIRMIKHKGAAATQWLIHWLGTSKEEATWEFAEDIMQRCVVVFLHQKSLEQANVVKLEGNVLFGNGHYEEALLQYELALQLAPPDMPSSVELRSICHSNRAICFSKLGKYEDAVKECTKALELNHTYLKALIRRAEAHEKLEQFEEAIADLKKILELDPSNVQARKAIRRLEPLAEAKREKMKEEMIGKLKDMGNSLLGRFGMSVTTSKL